MKIKNLSDIIPDIEDNVPYSKIGKKYGVSEPTIWNWVRKLRAAGYTINNRRGRKVLPL